jgi:DNA-3-methyladenine glycosylase I
MKTRCPWLNLENEEYVNYHDHEWGVPIYDDDKLFACLILEGAQAGLSWEIILKKRKNYYQQFDGLLIDLMANASDKYLEKSLENSGIIRNRLKVFSIRKNAMGVKKIQKEFGSFSNYIWDKVDGVPKVHYFEGIEDYPSWDELSSLVSEELKSYGMSFVGPKIIYAFFQAVGVYDDHSIYCFIKDKKLERVK